MLTLEPFEALKLMKSTSNIPPKKFIGRLEHNLQSNLKASFVHQKIFFQPCMRGPSVCNEHKLQGEVANFILSFDKYLRGLYHSILKSNYGLLTTRYIFIETNEQGDPTLCYRRTGWFWEINGWSSRFQENNLILQEEFREYTSNQIKKTWKMSTRYRLDLETLGSPLINLLKTLPDTNRDCPW